MFFLSLFLLHFISWKSASAKHPFISLQKIGALFLADGRKLTVNLQRSPTSRLFSPRQGPSNTRWREWNGGAGGGEKKRNDGRRQALVGMKWRN